MTCTGACCGVEAVFDAAAARATLARYRARGPSPATRRLLAALRTTGDDPPPAARTLLDVGGGVGVLAHELLADGYASALLLEASPSSLAAAREESARRGTDSRLSARPGDLVAVAADVPPADVVTLDKVVCCYPDMPALLGAAAARASRWLGLVYPRDDWWVRALVGAENRWRGWRGESFRGYVHAEGAMARVLEGAGLARRSRRRGAWWVVELWERAGAGVPFAGRWR